MNFTNSPLAPPQASSFAREHDTIYYALWALTIVFTIIVCGAVLWFCVRYRVGTKADRSRPLYEHLGLELSWSVIPGILALIMFYYEARLFIKVRTPPADAQEIFVIGKQWMWHVQHPEGVRENNTLHVPIDKPIKLTMISQDVIHAFYIPAFRTQMMVVPGRYTDMWFTPTKVGEYHLFCNMYCGTQHSEMGGTVVVMEQKDYAEWLKNGGRSATNMTMEQKGMKKFQEIGCNKCHGGQDTIHGPSLAGLFRTKREFTDGTSATADDPYLRESILKPHQRITKGWGETMPEYAGQLSEEDVILLIAYIKSIGSSVPEGATSVVNSVAAATNSRGLDVNSALNVNAEQFNAPSSDATPTLRNGRLSVGAMAVNEKK